MRNFFYIILFSLVSTLFAKTLGVVDTNVLLIKKEPSNSSAKLGFYKHSTFITILNHHQGLDSNEKWIETDKGFVKAQYVLEDEKLPKIIEYKDLDETKTAIQLVVINKDAKAIIYKYRQQLQSEKNLYIKTTKRAKVLFLVNIDSYADAKVIQKRIKKHFKDAFITNFKPRKKVVLKEKIPRKDVPRVKKVKNEEIDMDEIDSIIDSLDSDTVQSIEAVELDTKENNTIKTKPKIEEITIEPKREKVKTQEIQKQKEELIQKNAHNKQINNEIKMSIQNMKQQFSNLGTKKEDIKIENKEEKVDENLKVKQRVFTFEESIEEILLHME